MSHVEPLAEEKIERVVLFGVVPSDAEVICIDLDGDDQDIEEGEKIGVEIATPAILKKIRRFDDNDDDGKKCK